MKKTKPKRKNMHASINVTTIPTYQNKNLKRRTQWYSDRM